jgi:hypothetical protein
VEELFACAKLIVIRNWISYAKPIVLTNLIPDLVAQHDNMRFRSLSSTLNCTWLKLAPLL